MPGTRYLCVFVLIFVFAPCVSAQSAIPRRLTLHDAENLLIERNLNVLAAKYQIEVNRAARLLASYKPNPVLTAGIEQVPFYSPIRGSYPRFATTNPDAGANPVYTLRLDKIWERGGKRELRTKLADEQLQAAEAQMLDAVRTQLFELRRAFVSAALARESLRLAEAAEAQYGQTETLTQVKLDAGDVPKVELYRVAAGRLQYQQAVVQAKSLYGVAVHDVLNVLGTREQPAASIMEIVSEFDDRPVAQTLSRLREMALSRRPDVAAARHLVASATAGVNLAAAQRTRDVDSAYEYQRVGNDHSLGFVVQVPLFVYNNQKTLLTQAEAQKHAAEALLRQAELQAITDVEKAYQSYQSARQILDLYNTANLGQVEKLRSVAALSYKEGASSLLEFLDAQRGYNVAMTAYYQARSEYQMSLWQLEQASGGELR